MILQAFDHAIVLGNLVPEDSVLWYSARWEKEARLARIARGDDVRRRLDRGPSAKSEMKDGEPAGPIGMECLCAVACSLPLVLSVHPKCRFPPAQIAAAKAGRPIHINVG